MSGHRLVPLMTESIRLVWAQSVHIKDEGAIHNIGNQTFIMRDHAERYAHLLGDAPPANPPMEPRAVTGSEANDAVACPTSKSDQIAALTAHVQELRAQLTHLQEQFATFRKQFE